MASAVHFSSEKRQVHAGMASWFLASHFTTKENMTYWLFKEDLQRLWKFQKKKKVHKFGILKTEKRFKFVLPALGNQKLFAVKRLRTQYCKILKE